MTDQNNQQVARLQDAPRPLSILQSIAERYSMTAANFEATLRATVVPKDCTREQLAAFLIVAKEYDLNPITKEIYAFPTRAGGIQPILSIDGWMNIINSQQAFDGMEFEDIFNDKGELTAIRCRMYRKDRSHPTEVVEYLSECRQKTDVWARWPARMLRHKAAIQCARYAFGFSGIYDEDEFQRMESVAKPPAPPAPAVRGGPPSPPQAVTHQPPPQSPPAASVAPAKAIVEKGVTVDSATGEILDDGTSDDTFTAFMFTEMDAMPDVESLRELWEANQGRMLELPAPKRQELHAEYERLNSTRFTTLED